MKYHPDAVCPAGAPDPIRRAFARRCSDAYPKVRFILRDHRLTFAEALALVDETWLRAWPAFPEMQEKEETALAAGQRSPHHWDSWFCQIARRLLIDRLRQLKVIRRVRPSRARGVAHATSPGDAAELGQTSTRTHVAPDLPVPASTHVELRLTHSVPAGDEYDPVAAAERDEQLSLLRRALRDLTPQEQHALSTSLRDLSDEASAAELGLSRFSLYRLRRKAINRLRDAFRAHGYDVPTTQPTAWP
jgi:RNA polymerase sigma factor (sigma-70 family)